MSKRKTTAGSGKKKSKKKVAKKTHSQHVVETMHSSESGEHFTPGSIVECVHGVFGKIDLDPASCAEANLVVKAKRYFTEDDDGLTQPWRAKTVFVNPPGGALKEEGKRQVSRARIWWEKAVSEWVKGNARSIIFLAFSVELFKSGQKFTHAPYLFPFVVPSKRIQFNSWDAKRKMLVRGTSPTHSNAIILLPDIREPQQLVRFDSAFTTIGAVKTSFDLIAM